MAVSDCITALLPSLSLVPHGIKRHRRGAWARDQLEQATTHSKQSLRV